ncbi:MAG: hypothetical protein WA964_04230 [Ilumatobacter sp.]|uniref:hypothetical protein n=1 Tax=Ilumatobacter sp. TaxID=1967498 RepID=UPI003C748944
MTPLERLRLAGALAYNVRGSELRLHTGNGDQIVVSHHPAADLDPCVLRRVIIASACPDGTDYSGRIADIDVAGALTDMGGGVFRTSRDGHEQRWIASLLRPDQLTELLHHVGNGCVGGDGFRACLKPDARIGVTTIVITSTDVSFDHAIDLVAAEVAASCFVQELLCSIPGITHDVSRTTGGRP